MLLKLTFSRLLKHWPAILILMVAQVGQTLASLSLPTLNADIIDKGVSQGDTDYIWNKGLEMLAISLGQAVAAALVVYLAAKIAMSLGEEIRRDTFRRVQALSAAQTRQFGPPSLITRATNDVLQVQNVVFFTFIIMIMAPIMGIGGVIMAVRQDAELSLLLVVVVPVLTLVIGTIMGFLKPQFSLQQERLDKINTVMREQLTGVRVIRAFVRQGHMLERFTRANDDLKAVALRIGTLFALMFPSIQIIIGASQVAVIWFGGLRIEDGAMEVGSLVAFLNYLMQILMSVMMASMMFVMVPRAEVCAGRIMEVLRQDPEITSLQPNALSALPAGPLPWRLAGVEVRFAGASHPVLTDINLDFAPGTTTGIIGSTGCGKSTLVNLFARQIDPSAGAVLAGGVDIRQVDLGQLRRRIAFVPQKAYLFSGTVASTVAGLRPEQVTDKVRQRVQRALEVAQAAEFVGGLENGIDQKVEPGGTNFSGGQRQRLTIARALYREADLLVFDDSFSALDYATDAALRAGLRGAIGPQATVVVVAQRVASIRHADRIVVLEDGQVVGQGSHEELMEECQTYREIVASQLSAEEAA